MLLVGAATAPAGRPPPPCPKAAADPVSALCVAEPDAPRSAAEPPSSEGRTSLTLSSRPGMTAPVKSAAAVIFWAMVFRSGSSMGGGAGGGAEADGENRRQVGVTRLTLFWATRN